MNNAMAEPHLIKISSIMKTYYLILMLGLQKLDDFKCWVKRDTPAENQAFCCWNKHDINEVVLAGTSWDEKRPKQRQKIT
jgi:hypothetical protein